MKAFTAIIFALSFCNSSYAYVTCVKTMVTVSDSITEVGYACSDNGLYNSPPQGSTIIEPSTPSPPPVTSVGQVVWNPIMVAQVAENACTDPNSLSWANEAFREYWNSQAMQTGVASFLPDNKFYKIYFSDGSAHLYKWVNNYNDPSPLVLGFSTSGLVYTNCVP